MTDPATGQRSLLQALRVPFDLKGVAAGAMAYLAFVWGTRLLPKETGPGGFSLRLGDSGPDLGVLGVLGDPSEWLRWPVALYLGIAAVLGVACCRIAAVRLARDEGVGLGEAVGFSVGTLPSTLGAYLFMAGAIGFFYACNALAGLVSGIPGIGPVLMIVLFPLVLLSTLLLFLLNFGTVLGLPLVLSSLAAERNGALDAVSRGFSYVFSRPLLFFFYGATVAFLAAVLLFSASSMEGLVRTSFGRWMPEKESYGLLTTALGTALDAATGLRMPEFGSGMGVAVVGGWAAWLFGTLFHVALLGYVAYYLFGGATAAYFALRRDVDGTEDEEIWMEGEDGEAFGEAEKPEPAPAPPGPPAKV